MNCKKNRYFLRKANLLWEYGRACKRISGAGSPHFNPSPANQKLGWNIPPNKSDSFDPLPLKVRSVPVICVCAVSSEHFMSEKTFNLERVWQFSGEMTVFTPEGNLNLNYLFLLVFLRCTQTHSCSNIRFCCARLGLGTIIVMLRMLFWLKWIESTLALTLSC